jgi:hypothetical protein
MVNMGPVYNSPEIFSIKSLVPILLRWRRARKSPSRSRGSRSTSQTRPVSINFRAFVSTSAGTERASHDRPQR